MKQWYSSKTVWFNFIVTIVYVSAYFQEAQLFGQSVVPSLVAIQAIGNIILRVWFTKQPLQFFGKPTLLADYVEQESVEPSSINGFVASLSTTPKVEGGRLIIENNTEGAFSKNSTGAMIVSLKNNAAPVSGALVTADYYSPDNALFLRDQNFSEVVGTGMYYNNFPIPPDTKEGTYRAVIQAIKKADGVNFSDNFSVPADSASRWMSVSGDWAVENNLYRQRRENFMNSSVVSIPGALNWGDYSYEADVKWDSNKSGQLGIIGRWLDPTTFYSLYFDSDLEGGKLILRRGGGVLQIADYLLKYPSLFIKLKMVFSGKNIKCYADGVLKIDFNDNGAAVKNGTVGLYTQHIAASFSNVNVIQQSKQIFTSTSIDFEIK